MNFPAKIQIQTEQRNIKKPNKLFVTVTSSVCHCFRDYIVITCHGIGYTMNIDHVIT